MSVEPNRLIAAIAADLKVNPLKLVLLVVVSQLVFGIQTEVECQTLQKKIFGEVNFFLPLNQSLCSAFSCSKINLLWGIFAQDLFSIDGSVPGTIGGRFGLHLKHFWP